MVGNWTTMGLFQNYYITNTLMKLRPCSTSNDVKSVCVHWQECIMQPKTSCDHPNSFFLHSLIHHPTTAPHLQLLNIVMWLVAFYNNQSFQSGVLGFIKLFASCYEELKSFVSFQLFSQGLLSRMDAFKQTDPDSHRVAWTSQSLTRQTFESAAKIQFSKVCQP